MVPGRASIVLAAWLLGVVVAGAVAHAAEPLRVGMELSYPPFEMTDPQGRPAGVSVRLAEAFGAHLGRPVIIENIAFDGLIPALKAGHVDCVISSMTATPERAKSIAFSEPYLKTGLALLIAERSPVQSAAELDTATGGFDRLLPITRVLDRDGNRPVEESILRAAADRVLSRR
jgi:polar amino acid transport system substrate-binding protein